MTVANPDEASRHLHSLIVEAATSLREFGAGPVAIGAAPHKFNDADYDDFWCAVQIGRDYWEQSQFFEGRSESDRFVRETSSLSPAIFDSSSPFGTALLTSQRILQARAIINGLERASWRDLADVALGADVILSVVIQFDQTWFWIGNPQEYGRIYAVHDAGFALFAEEDGRLDQSIGDPNLIQPGLVERQSFLFLSASARRQFHPGIVDGAAARQFCDLVLAAADVVREITPETVLVRAGGAHYSRRCHRYRAHREYGQDHPGILVAGQRYTQHMMQQIVQIRNEEVRAQSLARFAFVDFAALLDVAVELDRHDWRGLFEAATGVDTFDIEDLAMIASDATILVSHRTTLFQAGPGGDLRHIGWLRHPGWNHGDKERLVRIARLDSAEVVLFQPPA